MIETFSIKYPKIKRRGLQKFGIAGLFIMAFFCVIFFKEDSILHLSILVMVCTGFLYSHISKQREDPIPYFYKPLVISHTAITLGDTKYDLEHVVNLKFEINEFDGQEKIIRGSNKYILNGTDNTISFIYLGQIVITNFYILSESQKDQFRALFEYWYLNKITFYEGNKSGKTYLLEKLNFKEIQYFNNTYESS